MTIIPIQQVMMMVNAILSDTLGNESEIDSLIRRVKHFTDAVNFWNRWMLWGLALAAVAAFWIVISTRLTVIRAKQLSDTQGQLDAAKDRKLRQDLSDKEAEIVSVKASNLQLGIDLERAKSQSERRQTELELEQRKTAQAQKETAEAQLRLRRYTEAIAVREGPRRLNTDLFLSELRGKPKAIARIWYKPEDGEAYNLAEQIYRALREANWPVSEPTPIPVGAGEPGLNPNGPPESRFSGSLNPSGITVLAHRINAGDLGGTSAFQALSDALGSGLMPTALSGSESDEIPEGTLVIVISKKP
jgi:hypothetical protein